MDGSKSLHNFSLPPGLTWGRQKFLRCMNVNPIRAMPAVDDVESSDSEEYDENRSFKSRRVDLEEFGRSRGGTSSDVPRRRFLRSNYKLKSLSRATDSVKKDLSEDEDEISVTREKLVMDFQTEIGKLKEAILKNSNSDDEITPMMVYPEAEAKSPLLKSKSKQRSTTYNMPPPDAMCTDVAVDPRSDQKKSTRPRRNLEKKEERPKFSVALSRKEIEDDFISMTGKKPPRKPKKQPRSVQNDLQGLYPGSRLSEVHPDRYKVKENGKV